MSDDDIKNYMLAVLSCGGTASFKPVQVQKLFFLLDKQIANAVNGPHFSFEPYDYGPYDSQVYRYLEELAREGKIEISLNGNYWAKRSYRLTDLGQKEGKKYLSTYAVHKSFIKEVVNFVLKLSFTELVSAIYKAYPEMKKNSIFQG